MKIRVCTILDGVEALAARSQNWWHTIAAQIVTACHGFGTGRVGGRWQRARNTMAL
jgi:hypothetical protein